MSSTDEERERTAERRAPRVFDIDNWSLRAKITAVLALPVTVAMVLGGLRVATELENAVHFTTAAEQIAGVPDLVALEGAMGAMVSGHVSGTAEPQERSNVEGQLDRVADFAETPDLPAQTAEAIEESVAQGRAILDLLDTPGTSTGAVAERQTEFAEGVIGEVDDIIRVIDDPEVIDKGALLGTAWNAQRTLFDQSVAMIEILFDRSTPINDVLATSGAELALLDSMSRYYAEQPDKLEQVDALRAAVAERGRLMEQTVRSFATNPQAQMPVIPLRASLLESRDTYRALVTDAAVDISSSVQARADDTRAAALRDTAIVVVTLLAALVLALMVSRSLVGPIRRLRYGALRAARRDLPEAIEQIRSTDDPRKVSFDPVEVHTDEEIGQLARAVDDIHAQALRLAGEQAHLRLQINDMFETLARRSKSLVDQQLGLIESLEFEEKDPRRLEALFKLDHLAARMRRNGENLLVLAGTRTRRTQSESISLGDVLRAAISEVEDYQRVQMDAVPDGALAGSVATDVVHMLAELVDNALRASPPDSAVTFGFARAVDGGVLLEIADRGIGIPTDQLRAINERLASGGEIGPDTARHMGLFVVSRLAERHGLTVRMRATFDTARNPGITVSIHVPTGVLVSNPPLGGARSVERTGPQRAVAAPARQTELPQRSAAPAATETTRSGLPRRARRGDVAPAPAQAQDSAPTQQFSTYSQQPARSEQPAPTEQAAPAAVPRKTLSGLPKRTPGASGIAPDAVPAPQQSRPELQEQPSEPDRVSTGELPVTQGWTLPGAEAEQTPKAERPAPAPRHRYRSDTAKTASFFAPRSGDDAPAPASRPADRSQQVTPIFAEMSRWLSDPAETAEPDPDWQSAGDSGWAAAARVSEASAPVDPEIGLPRRTPGDRLLPGKVEDADTGTFRKVRDPDAIRAKLSRHQQGVRDGRAARRPAVTGSAPHLRATGRGEGDQ
ncbi:HAMP domain-containing protein [Rhodococcus rhodnii]|uniref:histidine kinase n=2 Tax=Rhodococcus rhodnii TaxID=38312 RepID=R7WK42_9NOCA|nr:sensor histidine kinase [Rhodococcus rhodnii]EOM75691.1 sensor kinase [Rhodococcus rhodnii LMG 5362]TXG89664.1 HAMP domain-containing protein [Rhodococcus rhodnii]